MTTHRISFKDLPNCPIYADIVSGKKKVEGRKNSESNQKIKEGDLLILVDIKGELVCKVTYIHKYSSVREYLEGETVERALPCAKSIDDGVEFYEKFVSKDEIDILNNKYGSGFLGIGIDLIKEIPTLKEGEIFETSIKEPHFTDIAKSIKTVEGRLNKGMFKKMQIGDIIIFESSQSRQKIKIQIVRKTPYNSFKSMLETEGLLRVLPHEPSIESGLRNIYHKYYTPQQEHEFGVIALEMKFISSISGSTSKKHKKRNKPRRYQHGGYDVDTQNMTITYQNNKLKYSLIKGKKD